MKREFIDYMYELRGLIQCDIDRLAELSKQPRPDKDDCSSVENMAELRTRRSQIGSLNQTIEKYFDTHSKPL